ncbi:MAG: T9SS type A sorting domain-containing protein [Bacteroidota bacterium]
MKKIYLLVASLVINATIYAQFQNQSQFSDPFPHLEKAIETQNSQLPYFLNKSNKNAKTQGGPFNLTVNPILDIIVNKGLTVTGANPNQTRYLFSVFQDSTVSLIASNGAKVNNDQTLFGATLDPKSIFLQASFEPIVTKFDSYKVDTIVIPGSYVKKTPDVDTLYVWLQWGDSTTTSAYDKRASNFYVSPISTWRSSVLNPKISGASSAHGNKLRAASSNSFLVKYVLQPTDSTNVLPGTGNPAAPAWAPYGFSKFITVPLTSTLNPNGITIPAGNIVSCFYTFVPGGTTYTLGIPFYSLTSTLVPTVNGFAGLAYTQTNPVVTAVADLVDQQVDKASWNTGIIAGRNTRYARYANASLNQMAWNAALFTGPSIWFNIKGNSTVGLNELDRKGFVLGQNVPNPSQGESKVSYYLSKNAKSAIFRVTDVTGRLISSENVDATIGQHEVSIPSYAPGLYYYSLNVDGNISTNKLIAQ